MTHWRNRQPKRIAFAIVRMVNTDKEKSIRNKQITKTLSRFSYASTIQSQRYFVYFLSKIK